MMDSCKESDIRSLISKLAKEMVNLRINVAGTLIGAL
jgi:hypothetical protein